MKVRETFLCKLENLLVNAQLSESVPNLSTAHDFCTPFSFKKESKGCQLLLIFLFLFFFLTASVLLFLMLSLSLNLAMSLYREAYLCHTDSHCQCASPNQHYFTLKVQFFFSLSLYCSMFGLCTGLKPLQSVNQEQNRIYRGTFSGLAAVNLLFCWGRTVFKSTQCFSRRQRPTRRTGYRKIQEVYPPSLHSPFLYMYKYSKD